LSMKMKFFKEKRTFWKKSNSLSDMKASTYFLP
jgi:hypothetical protein